MKPKRSLAAVFWELAAVLLLTVAEFIAGRKTALLERGYHAVGGEYLLLLLPFLYYAGKQTVLNLLEVILDT